MPDADSEPPVRSVGPGTALALVFAALADWTIVALMVAVSGFLFADTPESGRAGPLSLFFYAAFGFYTLTAPLIGFFLRQRNPVLAVLVAASPIVPVLFLFGTAALASASLMGVVTNLR
jgi:hypothetical protein